MGTRGQPPRVIDSTLEHLVSVSTKTIPSPSRKAQQYPNTIVKKSTGYITLRVLFLLYNEDIGSAIIESIRRKQMKIKVNQKPMPAQQVAVIFNKK